MSTTDTAGQHQKLTMIQKIENATPSGVVTLPEVADRFQQLYRVMNGRDKEAAQIKYEAEKFHFMKILQEKPELQQCTKLSLYGAFLDMAVSGLSFDPALKHGYLVSFNIKNGTDAKGNDIWEKRASVQISGPGELIIRVQQKQIKYADNPVLVYEGDEFSRGVRDNVPFLNHTAVIPRKSNTIIACYVRLERLDGSTDYKVMDIADIMRLKEFSKQQNSLGWSEKGLPGMVETKTIKHAFRSYPKMKLGQFTRLESDIIDPEDKFEIDYGITTSGDLAAAVQKGAVKDLQFHGNLAGEMQQPAAAAVVNDPPPAMAQMSAPAGGDDGFVQENEPADSGKKFPDDDF